MNIPCYFIIGKTNHQEEAGLDVSTVCSLFLLVKKLEEIDTFFLAVPQRRDCGILQTLQLQKAKHTVTLDCTS